MASDGNALSSLLGDRKAMEEERLARVRKRQRSISPPIISRKSPKIEEKEHILPSGAKIRSITSTIEESQHARKPAAANAATERMKAMPSSAKVKSEPQDDAQLIPDSLPQGAIKYPKGVVKKTWAFGHERTGSDMKLEEVLEPSSVRTAVLSSFQWDLAWVLSKLKTPLNGGSTKCVFVMQAKEKEERDALRDQMSGVSSFLRLCFPPMYNPIYCMHSKLMLLFHPNKLRIAIPTANLLNFDWGETGQMENSVFLIDLPRLPEGSKRSVDMSTSFGEELMFFIEQQRLDKDIRDGILNFDFSATDGMAFVHTAGGTHVGDDALRTGLLGVSHTIRSMNLATEDLEVDFAASSIGQLTPNQIQDFHAALRGDDSIALATEAKAKAGADFFKAKSKSNAKESSTSTSSSILDKVRVYFPTAETVRASIAGAAGTICLQRKYFEGANFPRRIFRDYRSVRSGLLSHNKILLARGKRKDGSDVAWAYVGSSNMSKSAWGELPKDRKEKKITCRNWECGVLLPVEPPSKVKQEEGRGNRSDAETDSGDDEDQATRTSIKNEDPETESDEGRPVAGGQREKAKSKVKKAKSKSNDLPDVDNKKKKATQMTGDDVETELVGMDVFEGVVDIPFEYPGATYDGKEPWYFTEQMQ